MAHIAIIKIRSSHDIEWKISPKALRFLRWSGLNTYYHTFRMMNGKSFMPQLALPYFAAFIEQYNQMKGTDHTYEIIDEKLEFINLEPHCDMIWLTVNTSAAPDSCQLAQRARKQGIKVVMGGIHPTVLPDDVMPYCDSVVRGEAENIIFELLDDYERGALKSIYRPSERPVLEQLPTPLWHKAMDGEYCNWVIPIQTSRGCRNACSFCSTTRAQGVRRRHRPIEEVINEIKTLIDNGSLTSDKTIFFTDNNIVSDTDHRRGVVDTEYAERLFKALIPLNVHWTGQGEINLAKSPHLLELAARSGCITLLIGFESLSQSNIDGFNKPSNKVEDYIDSIERLHEHNISLIGCFIFGLDHDTPDVFESTAHFINEYIDIPQLSILTPFPGTVLYRKMEQEGRILHKDWSKYDITHVVFKPRLMSPRQLEAGFAWTMEQVYSWKAIVQRSLRKATHHLIANYQKLSFSQRFISTFAPNYIYWKLSQVGRL